MTWPQIIFVCFIIILIALLRWKHIKDNTIITERLNGFQFRAEQCNDFFKLYDFLMELVHYSKGKYHFHSDHIKGIVGYILGKMAGISNKS